MLSELTGNPSVAVSEDLQQVKQGMPVNESLSDKIRQKLTGAGFYHWLGYLLRSQGD